MNVGEVWEWWDPELDEPELFLILKREYGPNGAAALMMNLESGEVETNFPDYSKEYWTRRF